MAVTGWGRKDGFLREREIRTGGEERSFHGERGRESGGEK